ncbi:uncharacterized protein BO97DRAFT_426214 [Aspergillus homomorphus CBS 101889]|uniref:Peptidase S1 domain-containing protein n=1 Tax=Aspergillus homomorphus (strain CBS 101889) TaxID=1450537 RepID=A0A395HSB2_ASPHC|nr:hypothetical protein BO97DRAFT_426214 [Aspergillus homomorphus CBS 101889]RAL10707.1 hypothetical protein BO97DRAFT_426214 [Aspergillus homomorphus CBS 101889]
MIFNIHLQQKKSLCGARVRIAWNSDRTTTIGGTVRIEGLYYALTALHPFLKPSADEDGDFSKSANLSLPGDGVSKTKMFPYKFPASFRSRTMYAEHGDDNRVVAYLPGYKDTSELDPAFWSVQQNWALFRLCDQSPKANRLTIEGQRVLCPSKVSRTSPRGQLWCLTANSSRPPVRTDAFGRMSGGCSTATGGTLPTTYHLSMVSFAEDAGAWIVDSGDNGSLFGMIVAQDDESFTSYAISAADVFDELRDRFPDIVIA